MKHVIYKDKFYIDMKLTSVEQKSKVYGTYIQHFASGATTMVKVWNIRLNKMIAVRRENIIAVID